MTQKIYFRANIFGFFFALSALLATSCLALSTEAREKGFVYMHEVDPTILISPRYASRENFVGVPIEGYKKCEVVITRQAAEALQRVQADVFRDGYSLVIYDAYRPQRAVENFVRWSSDMNNQAQKYQYYPRVNKSDVFELGYIAKRSSHSRGSTVDLTLIKRENKLHDVRESSRVLLDGFAIKFLDDGTVDMGSSFDLFDVASHYQNELIPAEYMEMRIYLKEVMEKHGFENYAKEWWHFTLKNEPYPASQDDSYFNFVIE